MSLLVFCLFTAECKVAEDPVRKLPAKFREINVTVAASFLKATRFPFYYYALTSTEVHYDISARIQPITGFGFGMSKYRRLAGLDDRQALFLSFDQLLTLLFNSYSAEGLVATEAGTMSGKITERSSNLSYSPSVNLAMMRSIGRHWICFKSGIGMNMPFYYSVVRSEVRSGRTISLQTFNFNAFIRVPVSVGLFGKLSKSIYGISVQTELNDQYSLFNKDLHAGLFRNSAGSKHVFGLQAPTFLYQELNSHNFPARHVMLYVVLSRTF
jgi:hypothetical protein